MHCKAWETMSFKIRLMNKNRWQHTHQLGKLAYQTITGAVKDSANDSTLIHKIVLLFCAVLLYFHWTQIPKCWFCFCSSLEEVLLWLTSCSSQGFSTAFKVKHKWHATWVSTVHYAIKKKKRTQALLKCIEFIRCKKIAQNIPIYKMLKIFYIVPMDLYKDPFCSCWWNNSTQDEHAPANNKPWFYSVKIYYLIIITL